METLYISITEYNKLKTEIEKIKDENKELTERLKKYTNSMRQLKYYNNNKEIVKEKAKSYIKKITEENPEKIKEWRHTAYLNRKAKLQQQNNNTN
jgi:cell division septum initiation protein DivIVA